MIRKLVYALLAAALTACTPRLFPPPSPAGPTALPPTPTAIPLSGPSVDAPGLVSIQMVDPENGWGVSEEKILRTNDGAGTWHDVTPQNPGQLGYAVDSEFLDPEHGWFLVPDSTDMLKGVLYRTADGGSSWDKFEVPFGGGALQFLDPKHGWMMASLGAGAGSMGVAVFQTEDGGATWTQTFVNDPNQPNASASLPLGGLKDGLTPIDMHTAWIGGVIYTPGEIYLFRTGDGGATWQPVTVKPPDGYDQAEFETRGPFFANPNVAYLPVTVSSQNGVMLAMYVSHDGGNTWTLAPSLIPQSGTTDFVTEKDGIVWNGSVFYVTHDGAQTWTTVTPDIAFADSFAGMDFVTPNVGFVLTGDASGAHGLYKTTDGGATWQTLAK